MSKGKNKKKNKSLTTKDFSTMREDIPPAKMPKVDTDYYRRKEKQRKRTYTY